MFSFQGQGTGTWELGNLTIVGDNGQDIEIEGGFGGFRIHDLDIRSTSERFAQIGYSTLPDQLYDGRPVYRNRSILFDHILLETTASVHFLKIWGTNHVAWSEPDDFGTDNFIFIEDSEFRYSGTTGTITDTEGGGRFVFRHNTVVNGMVAMHCTGSTQGMRGNRAVEIYANTFTCSNETGGDECNSLYAFEATRGGTGIFFDNQISGDYFTSVWPMHGRIAWDPGTGFLDWSFGTKCGTAGTRRMCLDAQVHCTEGNRGPTARPHGYSGSDWGDSICANRGEGQAGPDWSCSSDSDCNDLEGRPGKCVQIDGLGRTGSEVEGWPCRDQFGRGQDDPTTGEQAAAPIYWWDNTWQGSPQPDIPANQYTPFYQEDRDWCGHDPSTPCGARAAWTYTPFTYPHPGQRGEWGTTGSAPSVPVLLSPEDEERGLPTNPTFTWMASERATAYDLQVARDDTFTEIELDQTAIVETSYQASGLSAGYRLKWRVRASNAHGTSGWSETWHFFTTDSVADADEPGAEGSADAGPDTGVRDDADVGAGAGDTGCGCSSASPAGSGLAMVCTLMVLTSLAIRGIIRRPRTVERLPPPPAGVSRCSWQQRHAMSTGLWNGNERHTRHREELDPPRRADSDLVRDQDDEGGQRGAFTLGADDLSARVRRDRGRPAR